MPPCPQVTGAMLHYAVYVYVQCTVYGGDEQQEQMAPKDPEAANFASLPSSSASH